MAIFFPKVDIFTWLIIYLELIYFKHFLTTFAKNSEAQIKLLNCRE